MDSSGINSYADERGNVRSFDGFYVYLKNGTTETIFSIIAKNNSTASRKVTR